MGSKLLKYLFSGCCLFLLLQSCSVSKQIQKQANASLLQDSVITTGHIGISIFEPATNSYWYNYNADKYFVPASNTKLFTLYAGMKYLGDSLVGLRVFEYEDNIILAANGDPTLLHPDFRNQPVYKFISSITKTIWGSGYGFKASPYGKGWAWDDFNDSYMNERSSLPIYGNMIVFSGTKNNITYIPKGVVTSSRFDTYSKNGATGFIDGVKRERFKNTFTLNIDGLERKKIIVPFITSEELAFKLLADTTHKEIISPNSAPPMSFGEKLNKYVIHSQPTDSLLAPMMHNSDNLFAEQTLLMASTEHLNYMNDAPIIDTLLKTDLKDVPQKPKWVDGSGLSRYNLFTPQSFVYILNKMKNEFGLERLKTILPTGGEGTLKNYYNSDSTFIYAKTGSLSNQIALSGFLITRKNKLLTFSILCNNAIGDGWVVRRAIERFLKNIRDKY